VIFYDHLSAQRGHMHLSMQGIYYVFMTEVTCRRDVAS
jgi:hypothetical protein